MTSKEQVLAIYPNAFSYRFSWCGMLLCGIMTKISSNYQKGCLAEDYTEGRAWDRAWRKIQKDMLRKLES